MADTAKVWFSFLGRGIRCDKNSGSILDHVPATRFIIKKNVLTYGVFAQSNGDFENEIFPSRCGRIATMGPQLTFPHARNVSCMVVTDVAL